MTLDEIRDSEDKHFTREDFQDFAVIMAAENILNSLDGGDPSVTAR